MPQISLKIGRGEGGGTDYFKCAVVRAPFQEEISAGIKANQNLKSTIISSVVVVANNYACIGLDKIEERLPILNQPTDKVSPFYVHMLSRRTCILSVVSVISKNARRRVSINHTCFTD